jgi:hypothetical protein
MNDDEIIGGNRNSNLSDSRGSIVEFNNHRQMHP